MEHYVKMNVNCLLMWLILLSFARFGDSVTCNKINACKCEFSDGSGKVDLTSLANKDNTPR